MTHSRRGFLQQTSAFAAAGLLAGLPANRRWYATANDLAEPSQEEFIRALALKAIDAARAAGASFADVRVAIGRSSYVNSEYVRDSKKPPQMQAPSVGLMAGYGVRAIVDGAWGFSSGYELTPESVARAAESAVARAKANKPLHRTSLELAPLPEVENGQWTTPIKEDPFAVPFGHQADLQLAALNPLVNRPEIVRASAGFHFQRVEQVFAATDGTVQFQRLYRVSPYIGMIAQVGEEHTMAFGNAKSLRSGAYGFEMISKPDLVAEIRESADKIIAESKTLQPPVSSEVGRFDLVFADWFAGFLLSETLGKALNLQRALGYQANQEGTSFAAPPGDILGKYQIGSPLLNVKADRTRPGAWGTVGWDDEGIPSDEYPLIRDGVIVDYHTSRETAPYLADWYKKQGQPMRSHGAMAGIGQALPRVAIPNLSIQPAKADATTDDLIADTKRGVYVTGYYNGNTDQQLLSGQYSAEYRVAREIRNGKLGARLNDFCFQFVTPSFWRNLDAVGGPNSAKLFRVPNGLWGLEPLQLGDTSVHSVPMRVRQVNVINIGRTA